MESSLDHFKINDSSLQLNMESIKSLQNLVRPDVSDNFSEGIATDLSDRILSFLRPFELRLREKSLTVNLIESKNLNTLYRNFDLALDWKLYREILFNLMANSIKFNKKKGKIGLSLHYVGNQWTKYDPQKHKSEVK